MWWSAFVLICFSNRIHAQINLLGLANVDVELTDDLLNAVKPLKGCQESTTVFTNGKHPCKNKLLFEDNFDEPFINKQKWILEQYTPVTRGPPDFEFVSYEKNDATIFINRSNLIINPIAATSDQEVLGTLDLRDGCTSSIEDQCFYQQVAGFILPPVKSAKVTSRFSFTYGKIEVKAKLPIGDWIYPQIQLLPRIRSNTGAKLWVAYSRGNSYYIGPNGDIGNTVLFGGLILGFDEPTRTRFTSKRKAVVPYGDESNTYTLIWEPDKITALYNDKMYDVHYFDKTDTRFEAFANEFYLSIGVGVGGINDFPDGYTSNNPKPWNNTESRQLKKFFDARNTWLPTWKSSQMHIDSVKIWAL